MGCHPTGMLRDEHRLILRVVAAFEALLDAGAEAAHAPDLRACADFFRLYTDRLHHGKEEDVLFQALRGNPGPSHLARAMAEIDAAAQRASVAALLEELGVARPLLLHDPLAVGVEELGDERVERPALARNPGECRVSGSALAKVKLREVEPEGAHTDQNPTRLRLRDRYIADLEGFGRPRPVQDDRSHALGHAAVANPSRASAFPGA